MKRTPETGGTAGKGKGGPLEGQPLLLDSAFAGSALVGQ